MQHKAPPGQCCVVGGLLLTAVIRVIHGVVGATQTVVRSIAMLLYWVSHNITFTYFVITRIHRVCW